MIPPEVEHDEEDYHNTLGEEAEVIEQEETYEQCEYGPIDAQQVGHSLNTGYYDELNVPSHIPTVPTPQVVVHEHHHFHSNQLGGEKTQPFITRKPTPHVPEKPMNFDRQRPPRKDSAARYGVGYELRSLHDEPMDSVQQMDRTRFPASRYDLAPLTTLLEEPQTPIETQARPRNLSHRWQPNREEPSYRSGSPQAVYESAFQPVHEVLIYQRQQRTIRPSSTGLYDNGANHQSIYEEPAYQQSPAQRVITTQKSYQRSNSPNPYEYSSAYEVSDETAAEGNYGWQDEPIPEPIEDVGGPSSHSAASTTPSDFLSGGKVKHQPIKKDKPKPKPKTTKENANANREMSGLFAFFRKNKKDGLFRGNKNAHRATNLGKGIPGPRKQRLGGFFGKNKKENLTPTKGEAVNSGGQCSVAPDSFIPGSSRIPTKVGVSEANAAGNSIRTLPTLPANGKGVDKVNISRGPGASDKRNHAASYRKKLPSNSNMAGNNQTSSGAFGFGKGSSQNGSLASDKLNDWVEMFLGPSAGNNKIRSSLAPTGTGPTTNKTQGTQQSSQLPPTNANRKRLPGSMNRGATSSAANDNGQTVSAHHAGNAIHGKAPQAWSNPFASVSSSAAAKNRPKPRDTTEASGLLNSNNLFSPTSYAAFDARPKNATSSQNAYKAKGSLKSSNLFSQATSPAPAKTASWNAGATPSTNLATSTKSTVTSSITSSVPTKRLTWPKQKPLAPTKSTLQSPAQTFGTSGQKQKHNPSDSFYKAQATKKPKSTLGLLKGNSTKPKIMPRLKQNPVQNQIANSKQTRTVNFFPTKTSTIKPATKAPKLKPPIKLFGPTANTIRPAAKAPKLKQLKVDAHLPRKQKIKASKIKAPKTYKAPRTKAPKVKPNGARKRK